MEKCERSRLGFAAQQAKRPAGRHRGDNRADSTSDFASGPLGRPDHSNRVLFLAPVHRQCAA
jgi:hypothetical protein